MMIGQIAVMKITKIAEVLASWNTISEIGNQASGGTVRNTWITGSRPLPKKRFSPSRPPMPIPTSAASPYPRATLCSDSRICQPRPLLVPPSSKKGWVM